MLGVLEFAINVPWFLPGVALWSALGFLARRPAARWLGVSSTAGWATIVAFGIILSATLTPLHEAATHGGIQAAGCDFSRVGLASLDDILDSGDVGLNILLFIPLGVMLGIAPPSRRKAWLIVGAAALPFIIETTQLYVIPLDRACQSADVVDNLTGFAIGLFIGSVVGARGRVC